MFIEGYRGRYGWYIGEPDKLARRLVKSEPTPTFDRVRVWMSAVLGAVIGAFLMLMLSVPLGPLLRLPPDNQWLQLIFWVLYFTVPAVLTSIVLRRLTRQRIAKEQRLCEPFVDDWDVRLVRLIREVSVLSLERLSGEPVSKLLIDRYMVLTRGILDDLVRLRTERSGMERAVGSEEQLIARLDAIVLELKEWLPLERDCKSRSELQPHLTPQQIMESFTSMLMARRLV
ncbi:hypothetical protein JNJ66_01075 [Candidatus Saccharibacteria bacterium]|nr:hypothetical protein [Candidatus Saccharibacteria bacterium]